MRAARVVVLALVAGCSSGGTTSVPLGGDTCARVDGALAIPGELVRRAAVEGSVSRDEALERLVADAIGASEARAAKLDDDPAVRGRLRAVLARSLVERLQADAKSLGAPTNAEIDELSYHLWYDVDRPPMRTAVHAVVLRPKGKNADELLPRARELAAAIRDAVSAAKSGEEMMDLAKQKVAASKTDGLEVKYEALGAVSSDGYLRDNSTYDPAFVKALFAIGAVGQTSGVVETPFGYHVIRLVDAQPEHRIPYEDRRRLFVAEVQARRARAALDKTLAEARAARPVEISPAAASILDAVEWKR